VDWLEAAGALTESQALRLRAGGAEVPQAGQQLVERAIAFREALARVLLARTEGHAAASEDLRIIDAQYARTAPFAKLAATPEGFAWSLDEAASALDAALRPIVESAVGLLTSSKLARLRRCGSPTCYWLFLDETKNCSRRWCEMVSCGNLMKVRRHRANRHRSA
jgi:predicted RNA-binding Zn ribbon-like protein